MLRLLFILGLFSACKNAAVTPALPAKSPGEKSVAASAVTVSDSLVPPVFVSGRLVGMTKSEDAWKKELTPEEFRVLREEGTERAFSGDLVDSHTPGVFTCAACGLPLFGSDAKFESGTGWPSFFQPIAPGHIKENVDNSYGMRRVEVECARCGGHQGHVFEDGPKPTGLRYCINSVSLDFVAQ